MCARFQPMMYAGHYISFVIRPAPTIQVAGEDISNVVDVRRYFAVDDTYPRFPPKLADDMARLHQATHEISNKAKELWDPNNVSTLYIQCQKGRSRSARCMGAFLMKYYRLKMADALSALEAAYENRTDGCDQELQLDRVNNWLVPFEATI